MPHHSKQRRPQQPQIGYPDNQGLGGGKQHTNSSFPSSIEGNGMGIQPTMTMSHQGRPVGWSSSASTVNSNGSAPSSRYHRVPESPDLKKPVHGSGPHSIDTDGERAAAAASVLLLAAAAHQHAEEQQQQQQALSREHEHPSESTQGVVSSAQEKSRLSPSIHASEGNRPLKKRKTVIGTENTNDSSKDPCNVSPMSHHSSGATKTPTPADSINPCDETVCTTGSGSSSYEEHTKSKDDQSSPGTTKEHSKEDHIRRQPLPVSLHWLLTESTSQNIDHAAAVRNVLHWLPHGQAWKIVRWDTFRQQILPKFFSEFTAVDGSGSIDAFLTQLKAWGFEEIRDGPDVGAFAHTLFRRGHPKLCLEMSFTPSNNNNKAILSSEKSAFTAESRSILRVPSLGSTESKSDPTFYGSTPPVFVNYRVDEDWRRNNKQTYSPIRIRSGRGARRHTAAAAATPSSPPNNAAPSFPVSNRGRRSTAMSTATATSTSSSKPSSPEPRSKRKLPLTSATPTPQA